MLVAEAAARAVEYVGLPEAALNLAEAVIYLARAPKSNAVMVALGRAQADVRSSVARRCPSHLRDAHYKGAATLGHGDGYVYPHDDPSGVVPQQYRPDALEGRVYYEPTPRDGAGGAPAGRPIREPGAAQGLRRRGGCCARRPCWCSASWRRPPSSASRAHRAASPERHARAHRAAPGRAAPCPPAPRPLGAAPASQVLDLDVVLAGQNPSGWRRPWPPCRPPGSPDYRHYLTAAQYAAQYGPSADEVAQVSSALRSEGLTVGTPEPGSTLLPVSGTASVVSAALGTPLESVQAPGDAARAIVNTASPQIPASLDGVVTGVVGLDGLVQEHSMIKQAHPGSPGSPGAAGPSGSSSGAGATTQSPEAQAPASGSPAQTPAAIAHVGTPQACPAAQGAAFGGSYTSTQLSSIFGLDQVFGQGRTGIGQSIAIVEFEQYAASDFAAFQACYGLSNPIRNVSSTAGRAARPRGRTARPRSIPSWPPSTPPPPPSSSTRRPTATTPRPSTSSTGSPATTARRS